MLTFLQRQLSKNRFILAVIIGLGCLIYANTLQNEMFWDDDDFILKNRYIKEWQYFPKFFSENLVAGSYLNSNYWRPALLTVFAVEWHLWQDWTPGWHMVNTAFHILDTLLLFFILEILFRRRSLALMVSLVFLAHPVQVESVVYVNSLGDSLSVFFMFAGLLLYLKFRTSAKRTWASRAWYFSWMMYIMALLSKESGLILPGLIIISDFYLQPVSNGFLHRIGRVAKAAWPYIIIAAIYVLLRATVLNFANTFNFYDEDNPFTTNFYLRLLTFFQVLQIYFGLMLWPHELRVERLIEYPKSLWEPTVLFGACVAASMIFSAFYFWKKRPYITFGVLWFFIGLFMTSNLVVPINALVYEHWLYVPIVGIALITIKAVQDSSQTPTARSVWIKTFIVLIAIYSGLSIQRNSEWRTAIGFYESLLPYSPTYRVLNNLGMEYSEKNMMEEGEKIYLQAIALNPENPVAYHNLAGTYRDTGRRELAKETFLKAITLDPNFFFSYRSLAQMFLDEQNYGQARKYLEPTLRMDDNPTGTLILLGRIAVREGNLPIAAAYYQKALEISPGHPEAQQELNQLLTRFRSKSAGGARQPAAESQPKSPSIVP